MAKDGKGFHLLKEMESFSSGYEEQAWFSFFNHFLMYKPLLSHFKIWGSRFLQRLFPFI